MTHTQEKPWKCSSCDYAGKTNGHLRRHVETFHEDLGSSSDKKRRFKCDLCEFSTAFT